MSPHQIVFLLGRRDEPTDAVEEYCEHLSAHLAPLGFETILRRVPWEKHGWSQSLEALKLQAQTWRGVWVAVQYTALAWSRRGFPSRFQKVLDILSAAGARVSVVFHDVEPYEGNRLVDKLRRRVQVRTMRAALATSEKSVTTVDPHVLSWRPSPSAKLAFIPVGANLPPIDLIAESPIHPSTGKLTIGVFSITGGAAGDREAQTIVAATQAAAHDLGPLRLSIFGREADKRRQFIQDALKGFPVEVSVDGVVTGEAIIERLRAADVLLFVRGILSTRRSSAIAGIACGLPLIAFRGNETAAPITEAGVLLVQPFHQPEIDAALLRLLRDSGLRSALAERSRIAQRKYFSWPAIAAKFAELFRS